MKYYKQQEVEGESEWVFDEQGYIRYIQTVHDALLPDLRLLCDRISGWSPGRIYLNDSNIKKVAADFGNQTVEIVLSGETLNQDLHQIGERLFTLHYGEVQRLSCVGEYGNDPPFAALHGDHIWDEVEMISQGLFEHRMLFVSNDHIELSVVFRQFRLTYSDTLYDDGA
jgi:hypothetical protein